MRLAIYISILFSMTLKAQVSFNMVDRFITDVSLYGANNFTFDTVDWNTSTDFNKKFSLKTNVKNRNHFFSDDSDPNYPSSQITDFNATLKPLYRVKNAQGKVLGFFATLGYNNYTYLANNNEVKNKTAVLGGGLVFAAPKINGEFEINFLTKDQIKKISSAFEYTPFKNKLLILSAKGGIDYNPKFRQTFFKAQALVDITQDRNLYFGPSAIYQNFKHDEYGANSYGGWFLGGTLQFRLTGYTTSNK